MKNFLIIVGTVMGLAILTVILYVGFDVGMSFYIAYVNRMRHPELSGTPEQQAQAQDQAEIAYNQQAQQKFEENARAQAKADAAATAASPLFVDPDGFGNEDNWLASVISREIAEMARLAAQPGSDVPNLKAKAVVDPDKPSVQVQIDGWGTTPVSATLTPAFAWDPQGYAPLAQQLLGATTGSQPEPDSDQTDVLSHLLTLTGPEIALEDVRVSSALQKEPASWQNHEQAALVLCALALRENADWYSDNRVLLCRATAHLALAQVLRGSQPASWPGLVADAAIRTMAGRELDALSHLDALVARSDCPDSAKTWLAALRLEAKLDWRTEVTAQSPLLLKIVWFQVLNQDVASDKALHFLEPLLPKPAVGADGSPDPNAKDPVRDIPDWARAAGRPPFTDESDDPFVLARQKIQLELDELEQVLKIEGCPALDYSNLGASLNGDIGDTVSVLGPGKTTINVIGAGGFKAAARRHLNRCLPVTDPSDQTGRDLVSESLDFYNRMDPMFKGDPDYELARGTFIPVGGTTRSDYYNQFRAEKKTWPVWLIPLGLSFSIPDDKIVGAFYPRPVPFGTVYLPGDRFTSVNVIGMVDSPPLDTLMEQVKGLPPDEQAKKLYLLTQASNKKLDEEEPKSPTPYEQALLKLAPNRWDIATDHLPVDKLLPVAAPYLDYCLPLITRIEALDPAHLSDSDRETILRKHGVMDPDFLLSLSYLLYAEGKDDESAAVDREGLDKAVTPEVVSSFVQPLVDYDLDHGHADEALKIAKKAMDDYGSPASYFDVLEATGRLDEADAEQKQIVSTQNDYWAEVTLYAGHPEHFPAEHKKEQDHFFPQGLVKVTLDSFSGPPKLGAAFDNSDISELGGEAEWLLRPAGLQPGDVIVALDGYKVESGLRYFYIQALSRDPHVDFIVWRNGSYVEVKGLLPHRRFYINMTDYPPSQ